jgi:hypothetical protein
MDKDALTLRERDAWAEFGGVVDGLTPEQRERPGVNVEGWTVKDVLWHIAHWWTDLAGMLDEMRAGTFTEPPEDDEATDAENARVLEESRRMSFADVERGVVAARDLMLAAWDPLPEIDEPAQRWFVWETIEHYEEHLPGIRALAEA